MKKTNRPNLKTKQFSTLHIEIFEQLLISGKTNRSLNQQFGYTKKSHSVVDHSRKVMYKLLTMENLKKEANNERVVFPRKYKFWWKWLLDKHKPTLLEKAVTARYYEPSHRLTGNEFR
ncbi:hypothetical protein [Mucilaginibacter sp. SP1R1]|uniref:hypothetical protein n=1 Tax=Mucilaginibacter sp. SP1R1 TaxID=2723091 RepID=UPI00161A437F|nr:hypothetical protein [Mucilaginibacter sp. SP1R1]MBB6148293.1 hypothetical protein [Mucilaginibacter sp. SP1R1]